MPLKSLLFIEILVNNFHLGSWIAFFFIIFPENICQKSKNVYFFESCEMLHDYNRIAIADKWHDVWTF